MIRQSEVIGGALHRGLRILAFEIEQELSSQDVIRGGAAVFFSGRTSFFFQ